MLHLKSVILDSMVALPFQQITVIELINGLEGNTKFLARVLQLVALCRLDRMASSEEVVYRAGPMTSSTSSFSLGMEADKDSKESINSGFSIFITTTLNMPQAYRVIHHL